MATISQIEVNGTIYDITDHHAASSYLPLSGGTVTGPLILQDKFTQSGQTIKKATNLQKNRVNPLTSNTWGNSEIAFVDANDNRIGFINTRERTNGDMEIAIGTSGGGRVSTLLTKDGKAEYEIPSPDNFTRAIKAKGLSHGIAITQTGDDLNNYFDIGTYYCATTAVATALLNKPQELTGAFVMYVGYGTGTGYPYQEIIQYNTGDRFFRNNNTTSNPEKWFPWKTFIGGKFLPLSGGTLTGPLNGTQATFDNNIEGKNLVFGKGQTGEQYYLNAKTPSRTGRVLFAGGGTLSDGDGNGTVVGLGAGGLTIVGGGEYAQNRYGVKDLNDGDEFLYLGADNAVYIESDAGTIGNRKTWKFQPSGQMVAPSTIDGTKNPSALIDAGHFVHSYISADHNVRDLARQTTTNNIVNITEVGRYINGAWRWNTLAVGMLPDGTRTYSVSDPAAFRDAIETDLTYLKLNGGTLTGELTLSGKRLFNRHTNLDRDGSPPASNTWGNSEITLRDKDDDRIGLINIQQTTDNVMDMWITPRHENAAGSEIGGGLHLRVNKDGTNTASLAGNTTVTGSILTLGDGTTAQINAKTPSRTAAVLLVGGGKKTEGDSAGTSVRLGAGGLTLVGGGEYANNRYNVGDLNDGDEQLYLGSDNDVTIESNGNTIANRYQLVFNKAGNLMIEAKGNQGYKAVYPYNSNEPPASNVSTQILCSYNSDRKREGAYVQPTWMANGGVYAQFGAQVAPGGTTRYNYLSLGYDSDGNPTVNMTAKDKWREALGLGVEIPSTVGSGFVLIGANPSAPLPDQPPSFRRLESADLPVVSINKGGTGATTANAAARALGLAKTLGDTIDFSGVVAAGHLTSASRNIILTIPIRYLLYGVTASQISVYQANSSSSSSGVKATARQNGKYILGTATSYEACKARVLTLGDGFIKICLFKTNDATFVDATNNDAVSVEFSDGFFILG